MPRNPTESTSEYSLRRDVRNDWLMIMLTLTMCLSLGVYVFIGAFVPDRSNLAPVLALCVFLMCAIPVAIWRKPQVGIYLLVLCAAMFVQSPSEGEFDPTTLVPIFWNVSTIGYHYAKSNALGVVQFNIGELIILMTAGFWFIQQIAQRTLKLRGGVFFPWLTCYIIWACFGGLNGYANGGDPIFVLWELRAQIYFYIAYLIATNLFDKKEDFNGVFWAIVIGIGIKSCIGTLKYLTVAGITADEGVLRHEDSLLMMMILVGAILIAFGRFSNSLRNFFFLFFPTAVITVLANGRRASIAAFIVATPIALAMCAVMIQERRKQLLSIMGVLLAIGAVYIPIGWNGQGAWALPARAIRSQFSPDERDASSDYYRLAENTNLKFTRDQNVWLGYGYGREYITLYEQYGRTDVFARILPHNGVLWIWMRLGHPGFFFFGMFVASVFVYGPQMLRKIRDPQLQVVGAFAIAALIMLIMYGKYDLAFANYRAMIMVGTLLGMCAAAPKIDAKQIEDERAKMPKPLPTGQFQQVVAKPVDADEDWEEPELEDWKKRTKW